MNKYLVKALAALGGIGLIAAAWVFVPPPRQASAQFVDQSTYGGTSGGSTNAQTITIGNYTSHMSGVVLRFIPNSPNTGPATINISGLGAVAIVRPSSIGNVTLSGGELQTGELTCVVYNGAAYQLACNTEMTAIGRTVDFRGATTPRGTLIEDGSAVSRSTYAALFTVIGTTYGAGDGSTTFNVPLSNGTAFVAMDNQGVTTANRITSAGSGCAATAVGLCGAQNQTLTLAQLPTNIASNGSNSISVTSSVVVPTGSLTYVTVSSPGSGAYGLNPPQPTNANIASTNASQTIAVTSNNTSGASHPLLMPILIGRRAIKY